MVTSWYGIEIPEVGLVGRVGKTMHIIRLSYRKKPLGMHFWAVYQLIELNSLTDTF